MELLWHSKAWDDYVSLQKEDPKTLIKINKLIKELLRNDGVALLGKSEILRFSKHQTTRYSMRIDKKNRLIYEIRGNSLCIASCLGHYDD